MGWASFTEDLEKVRDDLRHLSEAVRATSAAHPRANPSDGLRAELSGLSTSLVKLEKRLNVLLETATDPAIGTVIEAERALIAAAKAKEETKLIARKALRKSVARREAVVARERAIAQIKVENVELKAELTALKISGERNQIEHENNVLKSRIRQLQDLLGKRDRDSRR